MWLNAATNALRRSRPARSDVIWLPLPDCSCVGRPPGRQRDRVLSRGEFAEAVRGCDAAVHEEVAAGDEGAVGSHQEGADGADFVGGAAAAGRARARSCVGSLRRGVRSARLWRAA